MKSVNVKEGLPDKVGSYWCTIESEDFRNPLRLHILKDVCWFGESGRFHTSYSTQKVISWIDESEPDQGMLLNELRQLWKENWTLKEFMESIMKNYILIRK